MPDSPSPSYPPHSTSTHRADADHDRSASTPKHFVLDTNVLLHNPNSLFMFDDNEVVIPFTVLEELDKFKKQNDDVGRNARQVIRHLDRLRDKGPLAEGVKWNGHGGTVRVEFAADQRPSAIAEDAPDNRIIGVAWALKQKFSRTILISKDVNVRIKADALGLNVEDFEAQKVDADHLYKGYLALDVPGQIIDTLYENKHLALDELLTVARLTPPPPPPPNPEDLDPADPTTPPTPPTKPGTSGGSAPDRSPPELAHALLAVQDPDEAIAPKPIALTANQYVQLRDALDESHTGLARRLNDTDHLIPVHAPRKPVFGIMARNVQQIMALDILLDDEVKLVTLLGTAGTGKTLLAIAAGMQKVFTEQRYDKLLVARPIMPLGRDIGYLPGDKDEKLTAWMQPIFDNLTYLLSTRGVGSQQAESKPAEARINQMIAAGQLVLEPLTYIRGRSIPRQFIIVDEAQNLTPHEVKTIVSRVGEGTKIVLTGDILQIDNPYLDSASNGLSYMVERLKGQGIVGHVMLAKSERSELASLAAARL